MLSLHIANLGKLKAATFDVDKPLIVLCGPNNSGKTYAATVLYGLYESLYGRLGIFSAESLLALVNRTDPIPMLPVCEEHAATFYEKLSQALTNKLPELFGARHDQLRNPVVRISDARREKSAMRQRRCFLKLTQESTAMKPEYDETEAMLTMNWKMDTQPSEHLTEAEDILEGFLKDYLVGFRRPFFFPAERNAINLFARDLLLNRNDYLNKSLIRMDPEGKKPRAYAMPILDNIRFMETISKASSFLNSDFADLADTLEEQALQGSIVVSQERDLEFHTDDGTKLDAGMTSSLVKSLSGIVFYFRHSANQRDILFIDEPEANLHPSVQRLLTRVLVSAVNRGIRVVISTHSDIILQELNNLVMLSKKGKAAQDLAKKYQVDPGQVLLPEKLGVYVFGSESEVEVVEIAEHGFDVASISNVIDGQAAAAQEIFYTLFE